MAYEKASVPELIKDLSDAQIDMLKELQFGVPLHEISNTRTLEILQEHNLTKSIKYDHPVSLRAVDGVMVSDTGNRVVEELYRREREEAGPTVREAPASTTSSPEERRKGKAIKTADKEDTIQ